SRIACSEPSRRRSTTARAASSDRVPSRRKRRRACSRAGAASPPMGGSERVAYIGMPVKAVAVVTIEDVRSLALGLPRTTEALVHGRVKLRVGRIVYVAFSRDETEMGFAFPKEEREWLVGTEPEKFVLPTQSDLRYNWVLVRLAA